MMLGHAVKENMYFFRLKLLSHFIIMYFDTRKAHLRLPSTRISIHFHIAIVKLIELVG